MSIHNLNIKQTYFQFHQVGLIILIGISLTCCTNQLDDRLRGRYLEIIHVSVDLDLYEGEDEPLRNLSDEEFYKITSGIKHVYTSHCSVTGDKNKLILTRKEYRKAKMGVVVMIDYNTRLDLGWGGSLRLTKVYGESESSNILIRTGVSPFDTLYTINRNFDRNLLELKNGKCASFSCEKEYNTRINYLNNKRQLLVKEKHTIEKINVPVQLTTYYPPCE